MNLAELYAAANQRNALARRREPLDAPFDPLRQIPAGMTPPLRTGDVASMALQNAPGVGDVASLIDAYRAWQMGDKLQGGLSAVAALPFVGAIKAYHGSPHKFDAFDMSKIGTGEGAQAYGHGLYFAQDPKTAKAYADQVKDMTTIKDINTRMSALAKVMGQHEIPGQYRKYRTPEGTAAAAEYDALMAAREDVIKAPGHMYETSLEWPDPAREAADPMGPQHFLDWDRPLSEQPEPIQRAWGKFTKKHPDYLNPDVSGGQYKQPTGHDFYSAIFEETPGMGEQTRARVTARLKKEGIPGIRYLDAGSRGAGEGSSNFVVFDDQIPKITARNGQSVGPLRMATDEELRAKFGGGR